jgi:hypothetical protein
MSEVMQGQRVVFARTAAGTLVPNNWQALARAESRDVRMWEVTVPPVFLADVGPNSLGMPSRETGMPKLRITWGGGGVTWQTEVVAPEVGAVFTVAGEHVHIEVAPFDTTTVFASDLAMVGWIQPTESAASKPLFAASAGLILVGGMLVEAFARYLWVGSSAAGATLSVQWLTAAGGSFTVELGPGYTRIPVPASAKRVDLFATAGTLTWCWELYLG